MIPTSTEEDNKVKCVAVSQGWQPSSPPPPQPRSPVTAGPVSGSQSRQLISHFIACSYVLTKQINQLKC